MVLAPIAFFRYRRELKNLSKNDLTLGLLSGLFLAVHFATWITSLEYTSVTSSVVLVTTTPLWVAILSPILLKESISKQAYFGLLVAIVGTIIIAMSDVCIITNKLTCPPIEEFFTGRAFWGDLLAVIGAWAAAGYVLIGRKIRAKLSLIPYIFIVYGMAAIILIGLMIGSGQKPVGFSPNIYIWLVLLALIPQLLGHSTFNWALGYLPATFVAVSLLGEPIGSTILAYIFLKEVPGLFKLFGAILLLGGILIVFIENSPPDAES
jgi:drug/metabolite transporter (DMT)-like permease